MTTPTAQQQAYQVLGVDQGAAWAEVVQAYRALVKTTHPDRGGDPALFHQVREAYEVLAEWHANPGRLDDSVASPGPAPGGMDRNGTVRPRRAQEPVRPRRGA